jgi:hypothetical protein
MFGLNQKDEVSYCHEMIFYLFIYFFMLVCFSFGF